MTADVAVIGLGRVGLPLALVVRRPRPARARRRQRPRAPRRAARRAACRSRSRAPRRCSTASRAARSSSTDRVADAAARRRTSCSRSGTPSISHIEIDLRDIRSVLDDLLPHLRAGPRARPALDDRAGHDRLRRRLPRQAPRLRRSARSVFVAHVPERIAAGRFFEEIVDAAVHRRRRRRALGRGRRASCSSVFGAPIVQTTPVQAELAKIWTNILRYATFALPNLLMMDCEQYGANVFEVIDLINRDYPRGGMALPGLHRRHLPAQGLRLLRGALATRPGMLLAVSRVNESRAALPRRRASSAASAR